MPAIIDLTGREYGRLRVVGRCLPFARRPHWWCVCRCGWAGVKSGAAIAARPESCGCLRAELAAEVMRAVRDPMAGTHTRSRRVCVECRTPFVGHHAACYCSAGCYTASRSRKRQRLRARLGVSGQWHRAADLDAAAAARGQTDGHPSGTGEYTRESAGVGSSVYGRAALRESGLNKLAWASGTPVAILQQIPPGVLSDMLRDRGMDDEADAWTPPPVVS
jgi:hypothetical protein